MKFLKSILRKSYPGIYRLLGEFYYVTLRIFTSKSKVEIIFNKIYKNNNWGDRHSVSGPGSNLSNTENLRKELPPILNELNVKSLLDIPCGDFFWMKEIQLLIESYIGADIVNDLIVRNTKLYSDKNKKFILLDLTKDKLPKADTIFCRDCLPHLSFKLIHSAIQNIKSSGCEFLFTSTYTDTKKNYDIITGSFRKLNLELPPFNFPKPIRIINDVCQIENEILKDKYIGIWRISDFKF